jgi:hypothetical protein
MQLEKHTKTPKRSMLPLTERAAVLNGSSKKQTSFFTPRVTIGLS